MKKNVIVFRRDSEFRIQFAISPAGLCVDLPAADADLFAKTNGLIRDDTFGFTVQDTLRQAALFEAPHTINESGFWNVGGHPAAVSFQWMPFPQAIKNLNDGNERRILQLAVQFIAAGGLDDSIVAAEFDEKFIKSLQV